MPKKNKAVIFVQDIRKYGFKILFNIVLFFIFIGDSTILIFTSIYNVFRKLFTTIGLNLQRCIRWINSIKFHIPLSIPKISLPARAAPRPQNEKKVKKPSLLSLFFTKTKYFLLGALFVLAIVLFERGYSFITTLPDPRLIGNVNYPVSTQIYDRNGKLLYEVFRDQDRTPVKLEDLPEHITQATLAIEDKNFYNHGGISPVGGILRAVKDSFKTGSLQGGSTITQQLVKTSLLTPERTIERKVREAILAIWAERIYSKKEILQMYLNQIPYGGSAYGIEEAAKKYFNKPAHELTVPEAAFLAGLTRAPSTYSPYLNPQDAIKRRNEVLNNMAELGYISREEHDTFKQESLNIEPPKTFIRAPHFVFYVISQLEEKYGIRTVEQGGLRVVTTLDLDVQTEAEKILSEELQKINHLNVGNGAVLVTSPSTGEILAMVGSKDYFSDPFGAYNVTIAERQPGSSIKPLMYSLALERNYTAASIIEDSPVVFDIPGSQPYRPENYDERYHGSVPLRYALANSYNIPAVRVLNTLGVSDFIQHAQKMGITTWNEPQRYGLSLTLGGGDVRMLDMATAFGTFANYGDRIKVQPFISIQDFKDNKLLSIDIEKEKVLSPQVSFIISDILSDNFARQFAFGTRSDLLIPDQKVAVKTGTSNNKRDNWTIGYNRKYLAAVWVGNNDNTPMNPILTSGVTGASPIWNRVMSMIIAKNIPVTADVQPPSEFIMPEGIVQKTCFFGKPEYFKVGTENADCKKRVYDISTTPAETPQP